MSCGLVRLVHLGFPTKDTVSLNSALKLSNTLSFGAISLITFQADNLSLSPSLVDRPLCWWYPWRSCAGLQILITYTLNQRYYLLLHKVSMDYLWPLSPLIHGGCFAVEVEKAVRR
jgi:hypothetical protein